MILPVTVAMIPPHWSSEIGSSRNVIASRAANIGDDWVTGIVRDTSCVERTRWEVIPLRPKNIPDDSAAIEDPTVAVAGIPATRIEMVPTVV